METAWKDPALRQFLNVSAYYLGVANYRNFVLPKNRVQTQGRLPRSHINRILEQHPS